MQWRDYKGDRVETTILEEAIHKVYDALQLPYSTDVHYYNFKYPKADRMMLITKVNGWENHTDTFYLTIPQELRLEEASWSLYHYGHCCVDNDGTLGIEGKNLGRAIAGERGRASSVVVGDLTAQLKAMMVGVRREIYIWNEEHLTGAAIVLIYQVTGGQK